MNIDLEPFQVEITSLTQDAQSLKVAGEVTVTVVNNGSGDVTGAYQVVLFEDTNVSGAYEEATDNVLGEASIASGPEAGGAMDVSMEFVGEILFRDNLIHVFVDSANDLEETDEANNVAGNQRCGVDLSASLLRLDDTACPDLVTLTVRMGNGGTAVVGPGVSVAFYDGEPENAGALIGTALTTETLEPGHYEDLAFEWGDPAPGMRTIYARVDDDGTGAGILDETDKENNLVFCDMAICTAPPVPDSISGVVMDAVTAALLAGVDVILHADEAGGPGAVIDEYTTEEHGGFVFTGLDPGTYVLAASLQGYSTANRQVVLASGQGLTHQDLVLSPVLGPEQNRIVLTWGDAPGDLEAHLTGPNPEGCRHHCFYWHRDIPGASLDVDDTDSYGPETITITERTAGTYRFYVHDFTNRQSGTSQALSHSGAQVKVYFGSGESPLVFRVPSRAGTVWHVFDLDGETGEVAPINRMTFQDHPGRIDFPVITSSAVTNATWGAGYTYQVETVDPDTDSLTYSLLEHPEGMSVDPATGMIQWTPAGGQGGRFDVAVRVTDGRCGEDTQAFSVYVTYMPVVRFDVEPCSGFNPGGEITLSWDTERAETLVIDHGIGEVSSGGSLVIPSPTEPISYTMTATNGAGQVEKTAPAKPRVAFRADPYSISPGGSATLTWDCQCALTCEINQGIGDVPFNGTMKVTPTGTTTYTITATNWAGSTTQQVKVTVLVCTVTKAQITTVPICRWTPGDPAALTWNTQCALTCEIDQGIGEVAVNGSLVVTPTEPTMYTLSANGPAGSATASVNVPNLRPLGISFFNASPAYLLPGESSVLTWNSPCADTCTLDQGLGEVATSGTLIVTPLDLPTTYTITATSESETVTKSVTIRHSYPNATFGVSPGIIKKAECATLTWATGHATSCTIEPDIGDVPLSGSITVEPEKNTTYTLTVQGPGGTITRRATVSFVKPTAQIQAEPESIAEGASSTLSWVFSNADTCTIDPDIGDVQLGGSVSVTPDRTTTYTITAIGPGGTAKDSVTVTVIYLEPTVNTGAEPLMVVAGESSTLSWTSTHADACFIEPGIGSVDVNGSIAVSPFTTTTYTVTATGRGGVATADVTVTVIHPPSITVLEPNGMADTACDSFTIQWTDADYDDDATISLYYDIDNSGENGTLIVSGLSEDPDGQGDDQYVWDTAEIVEGAYYVFAVIDDGVHDPVVDYSDGVVTIVHTLPDETKLTAGDAAVYDQFGYSVSISGDYAIVGAPWDDDHGSNSGSAYIFKRDGTTWTQQAKLTASDAAAYDRFGYSVSISGDYAIVGAYLDADAGSDSGSAYIFKRDGTTWTQQAKLTASDAAAYDHFGESVSISGDTAIVGAPFDNDAGSSSGSAYIFKREGTTWTEQTKLTASDAAASDYFGGSVSISGDTAIVGAYGDDDGESSSGSTYVFKREGTTWTEQAKLTASDAAASDYFGGNVSISSDTAIVGAYGDDDGESSSGSAYIFKRDGTTWTEQAKLTASDAAASDYFGGSVSISSDTAIVGAYGDDDGESSSGSAYIFKRDGTTWTEQAKLTASDAAAYNFFARSVSISGDYAIVGAHRNDDAGNNSGAAYIYSICSVNISADPDTIQIGESSTLFWDSTHADSCIIEPGIGSVDPNGSIAVSPIETTTYTIRATGPGSTAIDSVIVHVYDPSATPPTVSLSLYDGSETNEIGESVTLSWYACDADSCVIEPGIGNVNLYGLITLYPAETTTYTIIAWGPGGKATANITIAVTCPEPSVSISADPSSIIAGESSILSWNTTHADSCVIEPGIGDVDPNESISVSPVETTTYTITATGPGGTATNSVTVTVSDPEPTVTINADPETIQAGESTTLSWTSTNANMCEIDHGIGTVDVSGSITVSPDENTTYTITATSPAGTATASVTVTVISYPEPFVSISATPETIQVGESYTLSWSSTHAQSCIIEPYIGSVDANGSTQVSPTETTTYTITATGAGGTATASVTVTVLQPPTVSINADPETVQIGDSCTLTWSSSNAQSCVIEPDIGNVGVDGSIIVSPTRMTIYTITATGPGGTATASVRVFVRTVDGYSYGDPTPAEQAHLEAINRARRDPQAEATRLGIDLLEGVPEEMITGYPVQPLTFNAQLLEAAYLHSKDMVDQEYFSHYSPDGRTPYDRIEEAGYEYSFIGENIGGHFSSVPMDEADTVLTIHDDLFIDEGVEGRGHRVNILYDDFKEAGIGVASGPYGGEPYGYMLTCDFGSSSRQPNSFLLGVVYDDQDSDGIYDAGEGIGDVEIVVVESGAETYTASAGGYAIALPQGYYTVEAALPDGRKIEREFTITNQNVKVDFLLSDFNFPWPAVTISAEPQTIEEGGSSTLTWSSTDVTSCIIEPGVGSVDLNGSISVSPTEITTYTITATGPGGTATDTVIVCVYDPSMPLAVSMNAAPVSIEAGESSTLTWTSTNTTSCVIEPGIGSVDVNGSITVSPAETTAYAIIATGTGGTAMASVTVMVTYPYAIVNGTVADAVTGQPIDGVIVSAIDSVKAQSTETGATGEFEIVNITPGAITVTFTTDGYTPLEAPLTIEGGQTITMNVSLDACQGATLIGTVTDRATGQPLAGATVSVTDADKTQSLQTLNDGSYSITDITIGSAEITVTHPGYFPETCQMSYYTEHVYTLDFALYDESSLVTVYGTITNAKTLQPEPGVSITVVGTDISDVSLEDGRFTLCDVPMGWQSFKVFKEDVVDVTWATKITKDPYQLDLVFPHIIGSAHPQEIDTTIHGVIFDAVTGKTLPGAIIKLFGSALSATSGPDGEFTLADLPPGDITLMSMTLDHEAVFMNPTVVPGASDTFNFHLPPTTRGLITGTVTAADTGEPIRYVSIEVEGSGLLATSTEADGTYHLVGVPAGTYTITTTHPEYLSASANDVVVADLSPSTVNFTLAQRPETGALEGIITDKDAGDPISGANLEVEGSTITGVTDVNGYYYLNGLPAGLVTISINASGYPPTIRTTAVVADKDYATPTTTTANFSLNAIDPTLPDSISELIMAEEGGSVESPDKRFMLVLPPEALSADAIVTLMSPTNGPTVSAGDDLNLDPELCMTNIKAIGKMTRVVVEPAVEGAEIPTIDGWVLISGRYSETDVDEFHIAESSIFPYYWDGSYWTAMRTKPYEMMVDPINNLPMAVLDFSTTATGNPITAKLGYKKPILLASLDDHIPDLDWASIFDFYLAGVLEDLIPPPSANVTIIDKDKLDAVPNDETDIKHPNPNALPLVIIHGWDEKSIWMDYKGADPNTEDRYPTLLEDLVKATNGVYRPVFISHNSRASMIDIGGALARQFHGEYLNQPGKIKGNPANPADPNSGKFAYIDTFGYSFGGLVSRAYQSYGGKAHNMVLAATPNHGTFGFINYLEALGLLPHPVTRLGGGAITFIKILSPGTADLLGYDDRLPCLISGNPSLWELNRNPASFAQTQMSLIAGTDGNDLSDMYFGEENDTILPVSSVFCHTSNPFDGEKSWFPATKTKRVTDGFSHENFATDKYSISTHRELRNAIFQGLSDWVVAREADNPNTVCFDNHWLLPDLASGGFGRARVKVEYNVYGRDVDRVVLVIYARDKRGKWHIAECKSNRWIAEWRDNGADPDGKVIEDKVKAIDGNSVYREEGDELYLTAYCTFPKVVEADPTTAIVEVVPCLIPLKPHQDRVPLDPLGADFAIPAEASKP